jgi:signal peptidase I
VGSDGVGDSPLNVEQYDGEAAESLEDSAAAASSDDLAAHTAADDLATAAAIRKVRRRVAIGVVALLVLFAIRAWVVEPVRVRESSMVPTLHDGDALVIDRFSYHFRDPEVGEVVTAHIDATDSDVVKRVVAVGGDTIGIDDGDLILNGEVVDQSYAKLDQMAGYFWGPLTVPDGYVFLMGDNRLESIDSRNYGPVPVDDVDGRYVARFWPL